MKPDFTGMNGGGTVYSIVFYAALFNSVYAQQFYRQLFSF